MGSNYSARKTLIGSSTLLAVWGNSTLTAEEER